MKLPTISPALDGLKWFLFQKCSREYHINEICGSIYHAVRRSSKMVDLDMDTFTFGTKNMKVDAATTFPQF
jgi:hypothetical protein